MKKLFFFVITIYLNYCFSQDYISRLNQYDRINNYDVIHYKLDISVDLSNKILGGKAYITLTPKEIIDSISFDADNMKIFKITIKNEEVNYKHKNGLLSLFLKNKYSTADTLTICIDYQCNPGNSKGIKYFLPDSIRGDYIYQCWTQGQDELNHYWFPCYDFPNDRVTSEIIATVDDKYEVISNGKLIKIKHNTLNKTKTYHWFQSKQHVTYLISLVVGNFVKVNDYYKKIPTPYYVYKGLENNAKRIFSQTKDMIQFYEKISNEKYPWDKYSQTILKDFFGGMENTSATNLIDDIPDDRQYKYDEKYTLFYTTLIAHELAHMWYGDLITCKNWAHLWLNEGFAEYLPGVYYEKKFGKEFSEQYYLKELNDYLSINSKEKMPLAEKNSNNIYPKGALTLKMLRHYLGDKLFWKAIHDYTKNYRNSLVTSDDFQKSLEKSTGKDLSKFFEQWVYKAGHPKFKIKYEYDSQKKILAVNINQIQKIDSLTGIFSISGDLEIITKKGTIKKVIDVSKEKNSFCFNNIEQPLAVIFDSENKIIKEVEIEESLDFSLNKLLLSKSISPKIEAIFSLKKKSDSLPILKKLIDIEKKEKAIKVRTELLKAIANSKTDEGKQYLISKLNDYNPIIRKEILFLLTGNFNTEPEIKQIILNSLNDSSYSVITSAIKNLATLDSSSKIFDEINKFIDQKSYRNTIQEHVLGALVKIKDNRAIPYFKEYSYKGLSQLARNTSLLGLVTKAKSHPELYDFFIEQLKSDNPYFRRMSVNALVDIGNKKAISYIEELQKTEQSNYVLKAIKDALKKMKEKE